MTPPLRLDPLLPFRAPVRYIQRRRDCYRMPHHRRQRHLIRTALHALACSMEGRHAPR